MKEILTKAEVPNVDAVTEAADEYLDSVNCPIKHRMQVDMIIDEIFSNIAKYAYPDGGGDVCLRLDCSEDKILSLVFEDSGTPFNPLQSEDPDVTLDASERGIGGLGIYLVKKMSDAVEYEFSGGKNILTVRKNIA